jgi:hypothetical protein
MNLAARVSALCVIAVGFASLPTGCGGDAEPTTEGTGGKGSGSGGKPTMTDEGTGGAPEGSVPCGEKNCVVPEGVPGPACCKDPFTSACGVKSGTSCVDPPKPPPMGCPAIPAFMGLPIAACCTPAGMCGVDLTMLGQGCIDIATAVAMAQSMGVMIGQAPMPAPCTP